MSQQQQPGRYQRSFSGMIAAMLVLLLGIGAFVVFRAATRDELEVEPEEVDYLATVRFAQESDWEVVYPGSVPDDWRATSIESQPERRWGIGFLTPEGFAGLQQSEASTAELLATYVDEETDDLGPIDIAGTTWEAYEDDGGDLAYRGEVDGHAVLVYGTVPAADLQELAGSLTTEPLP